MRLVDADYIKESVTRQCDNCRKEGMKWMADSVERAIIEELDNTPTAQPHWIPCSERLPETPLRHPPQWGVDEYHESKPLIFQLANKDDDDIFFTGMLSGSYCDDLDGNTYFSTADACSFEVEKVIAWMPLPKPYGGESE